ncbi:MAG TPA: MFS transporter [Methylomirabilota bacterium]|nr:MFS transporter [Methylomirabilota bacterium]
MLLLVLAVIQFTTILDFLIMMPLGPQYMRVMHISPGQFGFMVSVYAISAGIAGLVSGFVLDRFERRAALLTLYAGFGVGTLLCALAPSYETLTVARAVAGAFGGVTGALVLAIVGDVIPENRRGRAMGVVFTAFSLASVLGVPIGLALATKFSWHAPFFLLAAATAPVWFGTAAFIPKLQRPVYTKTQMLPHIRTLWLAPAHLRSFLFIALVTGSGFAVIPYISPYMVKNVGLTEAQLPYIYFVGGICTIFSMNFVGRAADKFGKSKVFKVAAIAAGGVSMLLTSLPRVPAPVAIGVTTLFMVGMSGRMVPAMAMMTSVVSRKERGGFMGVSSAVQHFASGLASFIGGLCLGQGPQGQITRYWVVGLVSVSFALSSIWLSRKLTMVEDL